MGIIDPNAKIIKESRWARYYDLGIGTPVYASKFLTDGLMISFDTLGRDWPSWSESERLEFASAYICKPEVSMEDAKIIELLMRDGEERVRVTIAHLVPHHPDKQLVLSFLIEQLHSPGNEPKVSFASALMRLGGPAAITALREFHASKLAEIRGIVGSPNRDLILDFLSSCAALIKLEDPGDYRGHIEPFLNHPDEIVGIRAATALSGGPPDYTALKEHHGHSPF